MITLDVNIHLHKASHDLENQSNSFEDQQL